MDESLKVTIAERTRRARNRRKSIRGQVLAGEWTGLQDAAASFGVSVAIIESDLKALKLWPWFMWLHDGMPADEVRSRLCVQRGISARATRDGKPSKHLVSPPDFNAVVALYERRREAAAAVVEDMTEEEFNEKFIEIAKYLTDEELMEMTEETTRDEVFGPLIPDAPIARLSETYDGYTKHPHTEGPDGMPGASSIIACPRCGCEEMHLQNMRTWLRGEDEDIPGLSLEMDGSVRPIIGAANPSARREGMTLEFECEAGCCSQLTIWQHKGPTFIQWE